MAVGEGMLALKDICYSVPNGSRRKKILQNINLQVKDKSFVVITGPNGSGKSTIAKLIAGIIQPTSGEVLLDGRDITALDITGRARQGIGIAFQQPVRFKGLTVKDMISLAAGKKLRLKDICAYLSAVGLCAKDYVYRELDASLSGGELKRIEIAMAMARNAKVMVFDEPEAGIDLWSFHNLIRVFERMRDLSDAAIMIISHQERIMEIADEIVVLNAGEISNSGSKAQILPGLLREADACEYYKEGYTL